MTSSRKRPAPKRPTAEKKPTVVTEPTVVTAKLRTLNATDPPDTTDLPDSEVEEEKKEMSEPEDAKKVAEAIAKSTVSLIKDVSMVETPKVDTSKGKRFYTGPATHLMNDLYDAIGVPMVEALPGWERIALVISRACESLEKSGWCKRE